MKNLINADRKMSCNRSAERNPDRESDVCSKLRSYSQNWGAQKAEVGADQLCERIPKTSVIVSQNPVRSVTEGTSAEVPFF